MSGAVAAARRAIKYDLEFVDELPEKEPRAHGYVTAGYWDKVAEQLMANPGKWAMLPGQTPDRRFHVNQVLQRRLVRRGWGEVATRRGCLYVRFVKA